jgi:hypothetical protein
MEKTRYLEGKKHFENMYNAYILPGCSNGFLPGECGKGHAFVKNVLCCKEYCTDCGRDGSPIHQTRIDRWAPKVRALKNVGYLVITVPEEIRYELLDKSRLMKFRTDLKEKLKEMGYDRGLMRYHLFGDCKNCHGHGCQVCKETGAGTNYNPHLNILIDQGFIPKIRKSKFGLDLSNYLKRYWKTHFNKIYEEVNWKFSYKNTEKKIWHAVKYITRSTFRIYDEEVAESLFNSRLTTTWGKWKDQVINHEEKLANNLCTKCENEHNPIKWQSLKETKHYERKPMQYLKNGFYYIAPDLLHSNDKPGAKIKNANRRTIESKFREAHNNPANYQKRRSAVNA